MRESVKGIINEVGDTPKGQYMLGRAAARNRDRGWSQYHKGALDNGADMLKRSETLGKHSMSKLEDDVKPIDELIDELYDVVSRGINYKRYYSNAADYKNDIRGYFRELKRKIHELISKPYHQGYRDESVI